MEVLAIVLSVFALFGLAANSWGVDSRDGLGDDHQR
jgi:hypothetical protein